MVRFISVLPIAFVFAGHPKPAPPLLISTSREDITPDQSLPLGGYTERDDKLSQPGGDHLWSNTILLRQGKVWVAVASVEMLTIPSSLTRAVRALVPADVNLMLCATHTHSAPDSQMLNDRMTFKIPGIASFKPFWLNWYAKKIADGINQAVNAPAHSVVRVVDETWQAPCNRGRRKFAKPDQAAHLIHFVYKGGQTNLFWYTAHATFYDYDNLQFREDWPGEVNKVGFELIQGPLGDVSPVGPGVADKGTPAQKIAAFWRSMLATRKKSRFQTDWKPGLGALDFSRLPVALGTPTPHPDFAKAYKITSGLAGLLVKIFAPTEASVSAMTLGQLCLLGSPGEPSSQVGLEMENVARSKGYSDSLAIAHCNHWIGYLLTPDDYDRGGYEATLNFYGRDSGEKVVTAVKKLQKK